MSYFSYPVRCYTPTSGRQPSWLWHFRVTLIYNPPHYISTRSANTPCQIVSSRYRSCMPFRPVSFSFIFPCWISAGCVSNRGFSLLLFFGLLIFAFVSQRPFFVFLLISFVDQSYFSDILVGFIFCFSFCGLKGLVGLFICFLQDFFLDSLFLILFVDTSLSLLLEHFAWPVFSVTICFCVGLFPDIINIPLLNLFFVEVVCVLHFWVHTPLHPDTYTSPPPLTAGNSRVV